MIRSMYSGISGMVNHQTRMDVVSNNIANINTTGFKAGRTTFKDALYMALDSSGKEQGSFQVGTGISVSGISNDFSQGALKPTGRNLDLAISGQGFFGVKDGESGQIRFTRDGTFSIDEQGYLVNSSGLNVLGPKEKLIRIRNDNQKDDIQLSKIKISPDGVVFRYVKNEDSNGKIKYNKERLDQIIVHKFPNESGLTKVGSNLYMPNNTTGASSGSEEVTQQELDSKDYSGAQTEGYGSVHSGYLEQSNINLAKELTNLITTHRGYQANTKVFSTADDVLREIIELKR